MASTGMKFQIECPCGCGELVTATDLGFSLTQVDVLPCGTMSSDIVSYAMRKSAAYASATSMAVAHRDGLVAF